MDGVRVSEDKFRRLYERRKKAELDGLTGMDAEQADWEEGLEEEDGD